ncbi:hypothetical protein [Povalibacter sp.]|uniref:hypothetical protein n=1 Tax=Povalibacter sp. TaxID=1962978 RepID=UPI002F3E492C
MRRATCNALLSAAIIMVLPVLAIAAESCYQDDTGRIVTRRRPGYIEVPCPSIATPGTQATEPSATVDTGRAPRRQVMPRDLPASVSPIPHPGLVDYVDAVPVPDRWRIVDTLGYGERWWDPYNRNVLKGDRPVHDDWFFNLGVISDTVFELRDVPTPVGGISTQHPGSVDVFAGADQWAAIQNVAAEFVYYKGDTTFKPPDYEFRFTPVLNYNRTEIDGLQAVNVDPREGVTRTDYHIGVQAAFIDKHLRNVSDNYDFDSLRVGIQPFSTDFRGFLFQDNQLGARLFGTRDNNRWQYNLGWFRRLEKDTNSGLNDLSQSLRDDDVIVANLYRQDFPVPGFTSQATVIYNRNREDGEFYYNQNDFIERPASLGREVPRQYDVVYLGYSGDGHIGRLNLSASFYYAMGEESPGVFVAADTDIQAFFAAGELSMDFDWIRPRLSLLFASGDDDPFDDKATGFDAIMENPQFAGADTSYWIRQAVPLIGGGRVALSGRNGVLNSLRSSKDEGQSNFTNPGTILAGLGVDMDVLPTLRVSANANTIYFVETDVIEVARSQAGIDRHVGYDLSASVIWRPLMSQNIVVRASYAMLLAGKGFEALYPDEDPRYFLLNAVFAY